MGKGLKMPQFEIKDIAAADCQESFQIGTDLEQSIRSQYVFTVNLTDTICSYTCETNSPSCFLIGSNRIIINIIKGCLIILGNVKCVISFNFSPILCIDI